MPEAEPNLEWSMAVCPGLGKMFVWYKLQDEKEAGTVQTTFGYVLMLILNASKVYSV